MALDVSRYTGCLLGLACGDAVGTAVEFSSRETFTPVDDMLGGARLIWSLDNGPMTRPWRCAWLQVLSTGGALMHVIR